MKKVIIGVLAIVVIAVGTVLVFNAIKGGTDDKGSSNKTQESDSNKKNMKKVNVSLTYMGTDITPGKTFKEKSISKKASKSTLPSCAFEGNDNVYTYDNIEITANVSGKTETIYSVYFIDETAETSEGIKIGDTKKKLIEVYGDNYIDDISVITYVDETGKRQINFEIENDEITGIEYVLVIE